MSSFEKSAFNDRLDDTEDRHKLISVRGLVRAVKQFRQDRKDGWKLDLLSFRPLHDRPLAFKDGDGPIGTLARVELNTKNGLAPNEGLPPGALNDPGSP